MAHGASSIVFNTGEPAFAVDRNGRVVAWNTAATETFGHPRETAINANCWELLRGEDIFSNQFCGQHCPHREMALRGESINRCRMRFRCASGQFSEYTVSAIALFEKPGRECLIHLCRKVPAAAEAGAENAAHAAAGVETGILTAREMEVLGHLEEGHSTKEIATLLSISIPTVRNHVEHILHKLHCHSRIEAVAVGRRLGLV